MFSKIHSTQRQWRYSYAGDNEILRVDQGVEKMRVNCVFRISFVLTHHSSMYLQVKKMVYISVKKILISVKPLADFDN